MARRSLTIRRLDPWSVLKFGFLASLSLLAIGLLAALVVWFFVTQLNLIDRACGVAGQLGFENCGINGGNLFRALLLLGLLGVIVQTGLLVFFSFLHNLIADLVGGLRIGVVEETGTARRRREPRSAPRTGATPPPPLGSEQTRARSGTPGGTAASPDAGRGGPTRRRAPDGQAEPSRASAAPGDRQRRAPAGGTRRRGADDRLFGDRGGTGDGSPRRGGGR